MLHMQVMTSPSQKKVWREGERGEGREGGRQKGSGWERKR